MMMNKLEAFVKNTSGETREVLDELVHSLANAIKEKKALEAKVERMADDLRLLRKKLFGSSAERFEESDAAYQTDAELFNEFELCSEEVELDAPAVPEEIAEEAKKKKKGRKPLPKDLSRTVTEHDLSDDEKICACGSEMECIGVDVSEQLDYQPAKLQVIEHRCKKYGCARCNEVSKKDPVAKASLKTASKPLQLIPKSMATSSLLAQIVIQKFCDHLPLYRQEQIFQRYSVTLSRQTMSQWMLKVGQAVIPLMNVLQDNILDYAGLSH